MVKEQKRTLLERRLDAVVSTAMAYCHQIRTGQDAPRLLRKLLIATRQLEKTTGKH